MQVSVIRSLRIDPGKAETSITLALIGERLEGPEHAVRLLRDEITKMVGGRGTEGPELLVVLQALRGILSRAGRSTEAAEVAARADRIRAAYQLPATTGTIF